MPVYAKQVGTRDSRFAGREMQIITAVSREAIPIPNNVVLCNGCNANVAEGSEQGYLVYLGKRELKADQPYDFYCEACLKSYFPKAEKV